MLFTSKSILMKNKILLSETIFSINRICRNGQNLLNIHFTYIVNNYCSDLHIIRRGYADAIKREPLSVMKSSSEKHLRDPHKKYAIPDLFLDRMPRIFKLSAYLTHSPRANLQPVHRSARFITKCQTVIICIGPVIPSICFSFSFSPMRPIRNRKFVVLFG